MQRRELILGLLLTGLSACAAPSGRIGPDGLPLPQVYRIKPEDEAQIPFRMLDGVNTLRRARGLSQLSLDAQLNAAAATHSRDMSVQNRPWHFGSDGSSPVDRLRRVGFTGRLVGETISETYETELETLAAWMEEPATRDVILDPTATRMGLAWYQEPAGKIWWTMVLAA
ncbi:CAP domain-containing protein [Limimaricola hongkongensis]|uniref:Putative transmembrane protein n=1 Tax=Limimaricola hongkongensis DSM 17492 TaxID=1122180 RepID=A0A017HFS1_9RHOB|nr:CAP domain-containing protein [Limimaricola hongkongensis]EYD73211.1 Putative transmembrane protein [Limimaricola hongkongensis DSM 17492]